MLLLNSLIAHKYRAAYVKMWNKNDSFLQHFESPTCDDSGPNNTRYRSTLAVALGSEHPQILVTNGFEKRRWLSLGTPSARLRGVRRPGGRKEPVRRSRREQFHGFLCVFSRFWGFFRDFSPESSSIDAYLGPGENRIEFRTENPSTDPASFAPVLRRTNTASVFSWRFVRSTVSNNPPCCALRVVVRAAFTIFFFFLLIIPLYYRNKK